ncbi:MAG: hypothetical protein GXY83_05495 [Rhodopirellula sp.]|nr:hypothetical protein [Rhodopirellula sp.]
MGTPGLWQCPDRVAATTCQAKARPAATTSDRDRFPTLRIVEQEGFERKESIPLEAVYAYIEAKHTLHLQGDDGRSITRACQQVAAVKFLLRAPVPLDQPSPVSRPSWTLTPNYALRGLTIAPLPGS